MKQISYGFWQEMYKFAWPMRFFIELAIVLAFGCLIIFLGGKILKFKRVDILIKTFFIKFIVFVITGVIYLIGRNKPWAIESDEKIVDWGRGSLEQSPNKRNAWKKILIVACIFLVVFTYLLAIIPDLPVSERINPYYMEQISVAKEFFQNLESNLSEGYESAPPVIIETAKNQEVKKGKAKKEKVTYLSLISKKGKKIPIQKSPKKKSKVICKVNSKQKIVYKNQYKKAGKKHWLKVYIVKTKRFGWIESSFVKKKQVEKLLKKG